MHYKEPLQKVALNFSEAPYLEADIISCLDESGEGFLKTISQDLGFGFRVSLGSFGPGVF